MTSQEFFMGIDPGTTGAVVLVRQNGSVVPMDIYKMPSDDPTLIRLLKFLQPRTLLATIEAQHAFPNTRPMPDGTVRYQNQTGQVKFIGHYQFLRGLLIGLGYPVETVQPASWQRALGCLTKGNKSVSKELATKLFPEVQVTLWNADALLIAEFGRRKTLGIRPQIRVDYKGVSTGAQDDCF